MDNDGFQVEMDICKRCWRVTPWKLGIARSILLVFLLPFQLPGTHKWVNIIILLPILQLQQEILCTLLAVHQPSPHGIQLFLVADPIPFHKRFPQDFKALLVFVIISSTASQDGWLLLHHRAVCYLLARRDHQRNCKLGWKAWHWQPDRLISQDGTRCTTPHAHPPQHHNNYCDCLHVTIKRLVIKFAHLPCGPTNKRAVHFLLGYWCEHGHQQSRQLTIYDAADRPAPQYAEQLKSDSYSFLGLPRLLFGCCGSPAGSWKDVSEADAGPATSLCEGLGDEQEEAGSLLQRCWDPSLHHKPVNHCHIVREPRHKGGHQCRLRWWSEKKRSGIPTPGYSIVYAGVYASTDILLFNMHHPCITVDWSFWWLNVLACWSICASRHFTTMQHIFQTSGFISWAGWHALTCWGVQHQTCLSSCAPVLVPKLHPIHFQQEVDTSAQVPVCCLAQTAEDWLVLETKDVLRRYQHCTQIQRTGVQGSRCQESSWWSPSCTQKALLDCQHNSMRTWGHSIPQLVHKPIMDVGWRCGCQQTFTQADIATSIFAVSKATTAAELKAPGMGKLQCFCRVLPWRQQQLSHHLAHKLICSPYTCIPELCNGQIARHQL